MRGSGFQSVNRFLMHAPLMIVFMQTMLSPQHPEKGLQLRIFVLGSRSKWAEVAAKIPWGAKKNQKNRTAQSKTFVCCCLDQGGQENPLFLSR